MRGGEPGQREDGQKEGVGKIPFDHLPPDVKAIFFAPEWRRSRAVREPDFVAGLFEDGPYRRHAAEWASHRIGESGSGHTQLAAQVITGTLDLVSEFVVRQGL